MPRPTFPRSHHTAVQVDTGAGEISPAVSSFASGGTFLCSFLGSHKPYGYADTFCCGNFRSYTEATPPVREYPHLIAGGADEIQIVLNELLAQ